MQSNKFIIRILFYKGLFGNRYLASLVPWFGTFLFRADATQTPHYLVPCFGTMICSVHKECHYFLWIPKLRSDLNLSPATRCLSSANILTIFSHHTPIALHHYEFTNNWRAWFYWRCNPSRNLLIIRCDSSTSVNKPILGQNYYNYFKIQLSLHAWCDTTYNYSFN